MVRRWERWRNPWDREYAKRGRLWRGVARTDPLPDHLAAGARILEVGCGDGKFLAALKARGYDWVGLDFSPRAIQIAREHVGGPLVVADARRLPFVAGSFGAVVARYMLGALRAKDRAVAAAGLRDVLAPGGLLLLEEFGPEDFRFGKGKEVEAGTFERNQGITTHYFSPQELEEAAGLPVLERATLRHTLKVGAARHPRVAHRVLARKP